MNKAHEFYNELKARKTCICIIPPIAEPIIIGFWKVPHCPRCRKRLISKEEFDRKLVKEGAE